MNYYTNNIQLDINVIKDIIKYHTGEKKMLVWGLGYDSKLWFNNNKNTYFVEDNDKYIALNNEIPSENIIKYKYKTTVENSFNLSVDDINSFDIPSKLLELCPFDIILIDGPEGWANSKPGRLLPIKWVETLSKKGSLVYIDDYKRKLESFCVNRYLRSYTGDAIIFPERNKCIKITL